MAAALPTTEPTEFRAGDTIQWVKSLADYSAAEGWTLKYYLVASQRKITITATASGSDFAVTISATDSATLSAGPASLVGVVTSDSETHTIGPQLTVTILPNFASDADVQAGFDGRTHARKMLDALESAQLSDNNSRIVSYTIFGERSVTLMNAEEWQKQHSYWRNIVVQEERQAAIDRGETGAGKVYIRRRRCPT